MFTQSMVKWGNKRANEYWEAGVPEDFYIPLETDGVNIVERWIRDKYEKKRFCGKTMPACANADPDLSQPLPSILAYAKGTSGKASSNQA